MLCVFQTARADEWSLKDKGMPTSFLYGPTGKLLGHHSGPLTPHVIEQAMAHSPEAAALFTGSD